MEYSVKRIDIKEESLLEITRFLQETFPQNKKFTLEFIRWQYAQNPLGQMEGFNAWDKDRIVSHFAGLPLEMNLFGKKRKGLLCINVSTNINYRGKKLFTAVGEKTIEYAKENGFDFLMAVPNANSTHAFLKYFGFYLISPLSVKVGFGKNIYPDRKFNCFRMWDDTQWEWRLNNPTNQYSYNKKGIISTPISFFAKTLSKVHLSENIINTKFQDIGSRPLNLYIGLGAETSNGLYFNIPSFIKRPPFNLVFKDLTGEVPVIKKEDIFLQLIDLDTI
ncbi:MAG: GNAT family N-acetyltransferase [Dysgonomonas sp.]|nr:GNAT family N-acetyltransferase [Dysgonomonas sp.]